MGETEHTDEGTNEEGEKDSPVITTLREENRETKRLLKEALEKLDVVATETQASRKVAAQELMDAAGLPDLTDDVLGWVEGDVTEEKVIEALKARSIPFNGSEQPVTKSAEAETSEEEAKPPATGLSTLGQQVADAAEGADRRELGTKIVEASSAAEVIALMDEADLTREMT